VRKEIMKRKIREMGKRLKGRIDSNIVIKDIQSYHVSKGNRTAGKTWVEVEFP
jgi:hypothetical protein